MTILETRSTALIAAEADLSDAVAAFLAQGGVVTKYNHNKEVVENDEDMTFVPVPMNVYADLDPARKARLDALKAIADIDEDDVEVE